MPRAMFERGLAWIAVVAVIVVGGLLAWRLYDLYWRAETEPPRPIRIFRTPTNNDFSAYVINQRA